MTTALRRLACLLPACCLLPAACCLLVGGCSGGGGLGAGSATLSLTISQLPDTSFATQTHFATRALSFDDNLVGGETTPIQGVTVRLLREGGGLDVDAITNQDGRVMIGALGADTYFLTVRGALPTEAISFPLVIEGPASVVMRARLERDQTGLLLNAQAITDSNNDGQSDDGFRLTVTGQRPSGGGTVIVHHSHGQNVPAQDADLRIEGLLDASGTYTVQGEPFIDTDDDGLANDSPLEEDIDGDGIPDTEDTDIDGDGIANPQDPDVDGDHLPNSQDDDDDSDGIPDAQDDTPQGPAPTP